jgi:trimeric autotransporter adhesin
MQLRPVTYQFDVKRFDKQWNAKSTVLSGDVVLASYNEAADIRRTGFIAQEVEKAAMVAGYNFSGIIKPKTEQDHYSLSYESFVAPLVKAIQELNTKAEKLEKEIELLKMNTQQVEHSEIPITIGKQQQMIQEQQQLIIELKNQNGGLLRRVLALEKK